MKKLTKREILRELQKRSGLSQSLLNQIIDSLMEEMKNALDLGEKVKISNFGIFELKKTRPRKGRNLKTGEEVIIPSFKKVQFNLSPSLRRELHNEAGE
ncbi:MAG: HU family DNA-binding protein [Caldimicrobium sp.]|nr:HU family DNA-binding protein [Caldimicrobium sp.]MCX7613194.1 HU family DNA-binding protein [Caldimicrobium sp.]MDW8182504.1 HU family DNA-binding protein [Caldimicrobium sp.]